MNTTAKKISLPGTTGVNLMMMTMIKGIKTEKIEIAWIEKKEIAETKKTEIAAINVIVMIVAKTKFQETNQNRIIKKWRRRNANKEGKKSISIIIL